MADGTMDTQRPVIADIYNNIIKSLDEMLMGNFDLEEETAILLDDTTLRLKQWKSDIKDENGLRWLERFPDTNIRDWMVFQFQTMEKDIKELRESRGSREVVEPQSSTIEGIQS